MTNQETILGLLRLGWSQRRIQRETGHRRETIARYGVAAGLLTSKPAKMATDPAAAPEPDGAASSPPTVSQSRSNCDAHRPYIEGELAKGRNAVAIYQHIVEHHGYVSAYNAVRRLVRRLQLLVIQTSNAVSRAPPV